MELSQLFVWTIVLILGYLVVNGLVTGSVWVRGAGDAKPPSNTWAHKKGKVESPVGYWAAMLFYLAAMSWLIYLLFR